MAGTVRSVVGSLVRAISLPLYAPAPAPQAWTPLVTSVRHRYHSERVAKGPVQRNYGYKETLHNKGLLPHIEHSRRLPVPLFRPKNSWADKRAHFGQNDYIDILGTGNLDPAKVAYKVPGWLRGFKGNEFQMLLRKKKVLGVQMALTRPTKNREMRKRIRYLYMYLNQKTKDHWWKKA